VTGIRTTVVDAGSEDLYKLCCFQLSTTSCSKLAGLLPFRGCLLCVVHTSATFGPKSHNHAQTAVRPTLNFSTSLSSTSSASSSKATCETQLNEWGCWVLLLGVCLRNSLSQSLLRPPREPQARRTTTPTISYGAELYASLMSRDYCLETLIKPLDPTVWQTSILSLHLEVLIHNDLPA
jgi:hypothetical protein